MPSSTADTLNNELQAVRDQRELARQKAGKPLTEYDQPFEEVAVYQQAIINMLEKRANLGQAALAAMWHVYRNGLVQFLGEYNPDEFRQWAIETLSLREDEKYIAQLVYVVERIFQKVHAQYVKGEPFVAPSTGEVITVDLLIERYGLVSKLIAISGSFEKARKADQNKLLDAVANKSRTDVEGVVDEVDGSRITIKLPYREIMNDDGTFDIHLRSLNYDQVSLFQTLIGEAGELHFS